MVIKRKKIRIHNSPKIYYSSILPVHCEFLKGLNCYGHSGIQNNRIVTILNIVSSHDKGEDVGAFTMNYMFWPRGNSASAKVI